MRGFAARYPIPQSKEDKTAQTKAPACLAESRCVCVCVVKSARPLRGQRCPTPQAWGGGGAMLASLARSATFLHWAWRPPELRGSVADLGLRK